MKKPKEILLYEKIKSLSMNRDSFIKTINKQIDKKQSELSKICTHSKTNTYEKNSEGGYDYTATYHKITDCVLCGRELKRTTTHGGYA